MAEGKEMKIRKTNDILKEMLRKENKPKWVTFLGGQDTCFCDQKEACSDDESGLLGQAQCVRKPYSRMFCIAERQLWQIYTVLGRVYGWKPI